MLQLYQNLQTSWELTYRVTHVLYVMVHVRVGKEFPDTRQNEREIKFIKVGDAIRTASRLRGEPALNRCP